MREDYALRKLQFRVLYHVFLLRVVDLELLSAAADTTKLLGQFAALFAGVSFIFTAPLILFSGLPQIDILTVEHFFIATTMVVIGLFSVLNWESIFPDRRDVLVLAPLPVRTGTLFLAKLAALAFAMGLSVLALNVFSGLVWPLVIFPASTGVLPAIRSLVAYWIAVCAAGAFMFGLVLAVQGLAAQFLPRRQFLRLSAVMQVAAFCLFLGVYILEPSLEAPQLLAAPQNQRLLACLPTYWFFELFQQLNGSTLPVFVSLARRAWMALAVVVFGGSATLLLSYFHTLPKIVEEPDILPGPRRVHWPRRLGNSIQSAVLLFTARTLFRSRQHRVILSFYLGIGFAIVLAYVRLPVGLHGLLRRAATGPTAVPFLIASILMMCIAVVGIRVLFPIPIALRTNWIFRLTELREASVYCAAVRRSLFMLGVLPIWVGFGVLLLLLFPCSFAFGHLVVLGLLGTILVEICLLGFKKVPFTCSYLPGKGQVQYVFWVCLLIVLPLVKLGAGFENRMLELPLDFACMIIVLGTAAACARWRTTSIAKSVAGLRFDEAVPPDIFALRLHRN